jgi:hypothetical protein
MEARMLTRRRNHNLNLNKKKKVRMPTKNLLKSLSHPTQINKKMQRTMETKTLSLMRKLSPNLSNKNKRARMIIPSLSCFRKFKTSKLN